mmetsp:Transcript_6709/g.20316  ORF Transcript_6709/g.20316 Transcript_6709/m.20316 type:complete len:175 (+) Transcript_6709:265-789(+)
MLAFGVGVGKVCFREDVAALCRSRGSSVKGRQVRCRARVEGKSDEPLVTIDKNGVEIVQRRDGAMDEAIGTDLSLWHYHESLKAWKSSLDRWFGRSRDEEKESEETSDRNQDEDFERELKLIAAATGYKLIDEEGTPTLRGLALMLISLLPAILVAFIFSDYLAHVLVGAISLF